MNSSHIIHPNICVSPNILPAGGQEQLFGIKRKKSKCNSLLNIEDVGEVCDSTSTGDPFGWDYNSHWCSNSI